MDSRIDAATANPRRLSLLPNLCASDSRPGGFDSAAAPLLMASGTAPTIDPAIDEFLFG